jgi:hypothetical protein
MPANSLTNIAVVVPVVAAASYHYSLQDGTAAVRAIPGGGTTLVLPGDPNNGDAYEFSDADGSCSPGTPVILTSADGRPVQNAAAVAFTTPFSWAKATFDSEHDEWMLEGVGSASQLGGAGQFIQIPIGTAAATSSTTSMPPGAVVTRCAVDVTGGYTAGTSITVGIAANPTLFQAAADNTPGVVDLYDAPQRTSVPTGGQVLATIAGAPIAGSGFVLVEFTLPLV